MEYMFLYSVLKPDECDDISGLTSFKLLGALTLRRKAIGAYFSVRHLYPSKIVMTPFTLLFEFFDLTKKPVNGRIRQREGHGREPVVLTYFKPSSLIYLLITGLRICGKDLPD
ncbi:hypothetical protein AVEN_42406-1 [Araneus ventricosus]|uniref:Uncharacterized protein n=1 Tax=Araneus ventricosus TaxID=182803 RepID=A0A4Y2WYL2_ARAVE|nr:hypothetical protein AVEN_42406-1 [Araneus ventricosus]